MCASYFTKSAVSIVVIQHLTKDQILSIKLIQKMENEAIREITDKDDEVKANLFRLCFES